MNKWRALQSRSILVAFPPEASAVAQRGSAASRAPATALDGRPVVASPGHGLREGALILALAVGGWLLLALLSYDPADPGWSHTGTRSGVANLAGASGAWTADVLLSVFGWLAGLLPLAFLLLAIRQFRLRSLVADADRFTVALRVTGFALTLASGCLLADLHLTFGAERLPGGPGGILGHWLTDATLGPAGLTGDTLLALAVFLLGVTLFTGLSWIALVERTGQFALGAVTGVGVRLDRFRDRRRARADAEADKARRRARVEQEKVRKETRKPPEIRAPVPKLLPSPRSEQEKQQKLFEAPVQGELPPLALLDDAAEGDRKALDRDSLDAMGRRLELKLKEFNVEAQVVRVHPGPVITRFEIEPGTGVKVARVSSLAKDLARALAVISVPHLLVAGTTGSGKSVGVNAMLLSLLYKARPDEVRLILVDPKMLELNVYEGIPHLLTPVVTDMKDAAAALRWCVAEMERRYRLMSSLGVRNMAGYNRKVRDAEKAGTPIADPLWKAPEVFVGDEPPEHPTLEALPAIVVVIDEFADMMMIVGKKVEELIARIAQKARAAGIHLILATQRPSVDVITGLIKANIPTRMSFQVSSKVDSRTILDQGGAEQLLGHGDMLYLPPGTALPMRVHGAFVGDDEVHRVVADWKRRGEPDYLEEVLSVTADLDALAASGGANTTGDTEQDDPLYDEAVAYVLESRRASISSVQRKLRIGYNRAARLIEAMEVAGVVSAMDASGGREVLVPGRDE